MTNKKRLTGRVMAMLAGGAVMACAATGCSASEDGGAFADEETVMSLEEPISDECKSAPNDRFISVMQDCSGCVGGKYVMTSGTGYSANPCTPYHILSVGGNQEKISIRTLWDDAVPTTQGTCTAAKLIQTWHYRGFDTFTDTKTGTWINGQCFPPQINRTHTHTVLTGDPGEFFSHLRILTDAKTAITHSKRFKVQICRGTGPC